LKYYKWVIIPLLLVFTSGCVSTRYLKDEENLFYKQKIKGNQSISTDDLTVFYQAKPNKRFPLIPGLYVWFYQIGTNSFDPQKYQDKIVSINDKYDKKINEEEKIKKKESLNRKRSKKLRKVEKSINEGNLLMRWGEPIAVLDTQKIENTSDQFNKYLQTKGYFRGYSDVNIKYKKRKAWVRYEITENQPYILDTLILKTSDSLVNAIISLDEENSLLQVGDNYDQEKITNERVRIETLLKNNGYFDFNRQYIDFDVDTALGDYKVGIRTVIKNRNNNENHRVFKIDSVVFTTDANVRVPNQSRIHEEYNGVTYQAFKNKYSYKILDRRSFIYPGNLYSREQTLQTQRQLANLDIFRFVNINYDSSGGKFIANIFASPQKRQQFSSEAGLTITYGYPGPFVNFGYLIRNIFRGLENLQLSARAGIEGVPSATDFTNILADIQAGVDASLIFPQFLIPGSSALKSRYGQYNPKTVVKGGFSYSDRPEYLRRSIRTSVAYTWSNKKRRSFSLSPFDMQVINTTFQDSAFVARLEELEQEGNNLINSFKPSFVSSSLFTAAYYFGGAEASKSQGSILRFAFESGGTFLSFFGTEFLSQRELEYYQYLRANIDIRKRIKLATSTILAYRINVGVAFPYSDEKILPYEKYFFAGGAVSNRAWRPRRLGPGSFTPTDAEGNVSYDIEQPGEVILETNIELRQKLSGILELAGFVDAGNIWVIRKTDSRYSEGGSLDGFINEIAVSGGAGIRFDFSYFVFRVDAAWKIYDPARQIGNRFFLSDGFDQDPAAAGQRNESPLLNFAIGYPF
jgi:hypothetical protein